MFECGIVAMLSEDEIWPDGGGPENPTLEDVIAQVEKSGSIYRFVQDWNMESEYVTVDGRSVHFR
jgi:hypothetical protein